MKKYLIFILLVFFLCFSTLYSQEEEDKNETYLGIGYGIGFFYPSDVNDYLSDLYSSYVFSSGTPDMFLNFSGNISLTLPLSKSIDFEIFGDIGWAPKAIVISGGPDDFYNYWRFSLGAIPQIKIPLYINSLYFGAGPSINQMQFEDVKASALGGRAVFGYNIEGRKKIQIYAMYDYMKGSIKDNKLKYSSMGLDELSYSTFSIGARFNFQL